MTRDKLKELIAKAIAADCDKDWQNMNEYHKEHRRVEAQQVLYAIQAAGFAIVPREANHDMKNVGAVAQDQDDYHHVFYDLAGEVYAAMIEEGEVKL